MTASTGINALAHCIEALYSITRNPLSTVAALSGVRYIVSALPRCYRAGDDRESFIIAQDGGGVGEERGEDRDVGIARVVLLSRGGRSVAGRKVGGASGSRCEEAAGCGGKRSRGESPVRVRHVRSNLSHPLLPIH